jgi:hypothetical protein
MKKILLMSALICLSAWSFAQIEKVTYDPFIYEVLSSDKIAEYEHYSPSKLLDINYDLIGFCYISNEVPANSNVIGEVCDFVSPDKYCDPADELISTKRINHRNYSFSQDENSYNLFRIGTTGYYVIVYPSAVFLKNKAAYMKKYDK